MRKFIITLCLIGSGLLILQNIGVFNSLLLLMTDGILPGTDTIISPIEMLIIIPTIAVAVLLAFTVPSVVHYISVDRLARQYMLKKKRTQKRRLSRV
jgi:hypothetical protein